MAAPAILKIDIIADASKAKAALGGVGTTAQTTGSKLGGLAKVAGTAFATTAVVSFGKASVTAATEARVATERLQAVFAAQGETTNAAAQAAEDYASALSRKIGVDDESIMAAQAQLATFRAVSDETARTAGVFDRATVAAADLAAAGFGTLDSNATQLGKALQDPIAGMGALARAGVTFTKAQKDQVAALVASGDLLGAQKTVLAAVEGQVKGTAEATVTSQQKMAVAFGETQEAVGNALLPVLAELAPMLATVAGFVEQNAGWLVPLAAAIAGVVLAVKAWTLAQTILNVVMTANPIGLIVLGIAALVAAIVVLVRNWDKVKQAFQFVFNWLKSNWPTLLAILTGPIGAAVLVIVRNWDTIKNAVLGVFNSIKGAATDAWRWVVDKFNGMVSAISGAVGGITRTVGRIVNAIKGPINAVIDTMNRLKVEIPGFDPPGPGPSFGGMTIDLFNIPRLAQGGTVMQTGMAIVHAGETFSGVGRSLGGSTVFNVTVNAGGLGADAPEIQRAVVKALRGYAARNGPLDVPVRATA